MMTRWSVEALEWVQVRALVARFVESPGGRAALEKVEPSSDREAIESALAETGEAVALAREASRGSARRPRFSTAPDISEAAARLRIEGASLEAEEIFGLIAFIGCAADSAAAIAEAGEGYPLLRMRAAVIADFRPLLREIDGKIAPDGTVRDDASPHLRRLRREIGKQRQEIQDSLDRFLKANRGEGVLQEEYVTVRNDRFVVPVLAGQRRKLQGVIHGASSTGQTVFLEPMETIDLNNELVRLQEDEMREVLRILSELTARLRLHSPAIQAAIAVVAALDLLFAKARFALEFECVIPRFGDRLHLQAARHPLLVDVLKRSGRRPVPFTLTLDSACRTLLISGPNTGGKTVTMKTIGVVALMAQAGLPVPCEEAELPVFEQVLADIGDQQSIENSLSTFSAHLARLREMALDVTPASLVLVDEIGSATDPEEGGALGVALVDHFRAAGAFTFASTHLTALKVYGSNTPAVVNASMGFDERTLEPTYQLRVGLPGKSAGLDIAERLGMPETIMLRARASLSRQDAELSRLISELHRRTAETAALRAALEDEKAAFAERERKALAEAERREHAKLRELETRFEAMERQWESRAESTIAKLEESAEKRKAVDNAHRDAARVAREMREEFATLAPRTTRALSVAEGARVRLKGIREIARVKRILTGGRLEVEAGFMKMQVPLADVDEVLPEGQSAGSAKLPGNVRFQPGPALTPSVQEINVIGEHAEDAVDKVERFLDAAAMATAARVRIVHGHGMGILKRAIADLLKSNPHVAKFYPAERFEGGSGATIVELKD